MKRPCITLALQLYILFGGPFSVSLKAAHFFQNLIQRDSGTTNDLNAIAANKELAVAVGKNGTIVTSLDGIHWQKPISGTTNDLLAAAADTNQFIAVGSSGMIVSSVDGQSWTQVASGTTNDLLGVAILEGRTVAVGAHGTILLSTNGVDFQNRSINITSSLRSVASAKAYPGPSNVFAAVGDNGIVLTSTDGRNWVTHPGLFEDLSSVQVELRGVHFVGKHGVCGILDMTSGQISLVDFPNEQDLVAIGISETESFDEFEIVLDSDGNWWRGIPADPRVGIPEPWQLFAQSSGLNSITFFERANFAVGNGGTILSTPIWMERSNDTGMALSNLLFGEEQFVASAGNGKLLISTNGSDWETQSFPLGQQEFLVRLVYGDGTHLLGTKTPGDPQGYGGPGQLLRSPDARVWTAVSQFPADQVTINGLAYANGAFFVSATAGPWFGPTHYLWRSTNAIDWTSEIIPFGFKDLAYFKGQYFALAGSAMLSSTDRTNWITVQVDVYGATFNIVDDTLFVAQSFTKDGLAWKANDFFPTIWGPQPISAMSQAGGNVLIVANGSLGALNAVGKWESISGLLGDLMVGSPIYGNITGLAYGNNNFVVTTSLGRIFQSEQLPMTISVRKVDSNTMLISTDSGSLHIEKANVPDASVWAEVGIAKTGAPLLLPIEPGTNVFLRGKR